MEGDDGAGKTGQVESVMGRTSTIGVHRTIHREIYFDPLGPRLQSKQCRV
jgi:thymidylate kinase